MEAVLNLLVAVAILGAFIGPFIVQMRIEKMREDMLRKHAERQWAELQAEIREGNL